MINLIIENVNENVENLNKIEIKILIKNINKI